MRRLLTTASDNTRGIKPPDTWQELQSFCVDAFPLVQERFSTGRHRTAYYWASSGYGKNGDTQHGVDIFDHFSPTTMQCKRVEKFDLRHLEKELEALKGYRAPLSAHFIVTSLEETNRTVTDRVVKHNAALEGETHSRQVPPRLPATRLPKLYVLNWPEIKAILCADFFLALKWSFHPFRLDYPNLNGVDLNTVIGAANSMGCSLPPGGGGKSLRVLEAINILTRSLDADTIASLGETETIASSTINGLAQFLALVDEAWNMGRRVRPALTACESLDGVSRHQGLKALNEIVNFQARIEAYKYLNRLADIVRRLFRQLDNEHYFEFGQMEIEHEGMSFWDTDERIRHYNFSDIDTDTPPWYISKQKIIQNAKFIACEIRKVRANMPPNN
ncbi:MULTISPECIES: hypothetical protein [Pseudomonas]|uniref:hypothetical protein n=1 Tax=Pseudomonas TaxID=286 RepID=UPI0004841F64|nr:MULTISPECIES: hypothetical protein [Pseudomonas]